MPSTNSKLTISQKKKTKKFLDQDISSINLKICSVVVAAWRLCVVEDMARTKVVLIMRMTRLK